MRAGLMLAAMLAAPAFAHVEKPAVPKEPPNPTPEQLREAMERVEKAQDKRARKAAKRLRDAKMLEEMGMYNGEVRGASRPAGEASSAEGATSTVVLGAGGQKLEV